MSPLRPQRPKSTSDIEPPVATLSMTRSNAQPLGRRRRQHILIAAIVAGALAAAVISVELFYELPPPVGPPPIAIEVRQVFQVAPGSVGCRATYGELCYQVVAIAQVSGVELNDVYFTLQNASNASTGPESSPVHAGSGAGITVVDSSGAIVGYWNWSLTEWTNGANWTLPFNTNVSLVFDSGLLNASSLPALRLWVVTTSPFSSAIGNPLPTPDLADSRGSA